MFLLHWLKWLQREGKRKHTNQSWNGFNLMLKWQARGLHINIDSLCVHHWGGRDTLTGKAWLNTKTLCEMLVRQQLNMLTSLIMEYNLLVNGASEIQLKLSRPANQSSTKTAEHHAKRYRDYKPECYYQRKTCSNDWNSLTQQVPCI